MVSRLPNRYKLCYSKLPDDAPNHGDLGRLCHVHVKNLTALPTPVVGLLPESPLRTMNAPPRKSPVRPDRRRDNPAQLIARVLDRPLRPTAQGASVSPSGFSSLGRASTDAQALIESDSCHSY